MHWNKQYFVGRFKLISRSYLSIITALLTGLFTIVRTHQMNEELDKARYEYRLQLDSLSERYDNLSVNCQAWRIDASKKTYEIVMLREEVEDLKQATDAGIILILKYVPANYRDKALRDYELIKKTSREKRRELYGH